MEDIVAVVGGFARTIIELGVEAECSVGAPALARERAEAAGFEEVEHCLCGAEEVVEEFAEERHAARLR
jgi:hypothetical protein